MILKQFSDSWRRLGPKDCSSFLSSSIVSSEKVISRKFEKACSLHREILDNYSSMSKMWLCIVLAKYSFSISIVMAC